MRGSTFNQCATARGLRKLSILAPCHSLSRQTAVQGVSVTTAMPGTSDISVLKGRFSIPAEEVQALLASSPMSLDKFLMSLVDPASSLARPPVSGFSVGAVGMGSSGAVYVGVNVEFPRMHLNNSIHAEQCLILNCYLHGETGIQMLAVSEAPCGHCRQFYAELSTAETVRFVFGAGSHWTQHHPTPKPISTASKSAQPKEPTPAAAAAGSTLGHSNGHSASEEQISALPQPANSLPPSSSSSSQHHHTARPTASYTLNELLPAKFGPSDLAGDDPFPLLLEPQSHGVALTTDSLQSVEERCGRGGMEAQEAVSSSHGAWSEQLGNEGGEANGNGNGTCGVEGASTSSGVQNEGKGKRGKELFRRAVQEAVLWANKSYTPYTRSPSGVSIITQSGQVFSGAFMESAAFNPSLTPFHGAWVAAMVGGTASFNEIQEVVIAEIPEAPVQQGGGIQALVAAVAPEAVLTQLKLRREAS